MRWEQKWKCNQRDKDKECGKEAYYHDTENSEDQYYCQKHWSIKLGFGGNNENKSR